MSRIDRSNQYDLPSVALISGNSIRSGLMRNVPRWQENLLALYRHRKIALSIFLTVVGVGLLYLLLAPRIYLASSRIRIGTYQPILAAAHAEESLRESSKENTYLDGQIQELMSLSLVDRALNKEESLSEFFTKKSAGFFEKLFGKEKIAQTGNGYNHGESVLREYLKAISVAPIRKTNLVVIEARSTDPSQAAAIANLHAETYIEWVHDDRTGVQASGLRFLREQAEELRERVSEIEQKMADYAERFSIVALNKDENITVQKMSQLNKLLTQATAKRIEVEHDAIESGKAVGSDSAGVDDIAIQNTRLALAKLEAEYREMAVKFTDEYPRMQQLRSQITELRRTVLDQRKQIVRGLDVKVEAARHEEEQLKEELEKQKGLAFELSKKQVPYNALGRELDSSRELLQNVLRQIKETGLAVESDASNISVVDPAVIPEHPAYPRILLVLGVTGFLGVFLSFGTAWALHRADSTILSADEVTDEFGVPCLGIVPTFLKGDRLALNDSDLEASKLPVAVSSEPWCASAEAFRSLRTSLLLSQAGSPPKIILVTSAQPGEGKTSTVVNLAMTLGASGKKVLIIDADLRRPRVSKMIREEGRISGLVGILTGQTDEIEDVICEFIPNVSVLATGPTPPNPSELLGSDAFEDLLNNFARSYDFILIDSPPVLPVTDAVVLSRVVDGVLLVVRSGESPRQVVKLAMKQLLQVQAKILGVVLNDVDLRMPGYYYGAYSYSYGERAA